VIELLLQAERALSVGLTDQAERLYRQAADNDPRNAIAVVGLARVALERSDDATAYREAVRALRIDPENVAARRLVVRLEEVFAARGEALPSAGPDAPPPVSSMPTPSPLSPTGGDQVRPERESPAPTLPAPSTPSPEPPAASGASPAPIAAQPEPPAPRTPASRSPAPTPRRSSPSLIDRLLRRKRP
jgi:tetratricopeptide (TPR) repeat protein